MKDTPGYSTIAGQLGHLISEKVGKALENVANAVYRPYRAFFQDFESCAVCVLPKGTGPADLESAILGCVSWGHGMSLAPTSAGGGVRYRWTALYPPPQASGADPAHFARGAAGFVSYGAATPFEPTSTFLTLTPYLHFYGFLDALSTP